MIAMSFFSQPARARSAGPSGGARAHLLVARGPVDFVLRLYDTNASGLPGDLVASPIDVHAADQTATGKEVGGSPEYAYSAAFDLVMLAVGKQYWLAISRRVRNPSGGSGSLS